MAYITQEEKQKLAPVIKAICKKYGVKGSLSIRHYSTLVLTVSSGSIDFITNYNKLASQRPSPSGMINLAKDYLDVNTHWYQEHFDGKAKQFLDEIIPAMKGPGWFDKSDIQSDYFHTKHYIDVNIGRWNKPYQVI